MSRWRCQHRNNRSALRASLDGMRHPARASCLSAVLVFAQDQGTYRIYQQDHLLGTEHVTFEQRNDSSLVISRIDQMLPRPGSPPDTLSKNAVLLVSSRDGSLRGYQSHETLNHDNLSRTLSMSEETYTSYRQSSVGGFGDTYVRPPGRIYVVDPQVFCLFDVICRDMHAQNFDERPITMLYITAKDTAVDGRVRRLGKESLKLGAQTVVAEKFEIKDPWSDFYAWVSPSGRMLRLTLPALGLRVERDPATLATGRVLKSAKVPSVGVPQVMVEWKTPRIAKPDSLARPRGR